MGHIPDSKVHGANMGLIWARQDPGGPHVGPMNFVIWDLINTHINHSMNTDTYRWNTPPKSHKYISILMINHDWYVFIFYRISQLMLPSWSEFGCQFDKPYTFPCDHQQNSIMLQCLHWYPQNALFLFHYYIVSEIKVTTTTPTHLDIKLSIEKGSPITGSYCLWHCLCCGMTMNVSLQEIILIVK